MPGPPPPPPPPSLGGSGTSQSQDGRGLLLDSIRAGKSLRKTVTVDKSAPAIGGVVREEGASPAGAPSRGPATGGGSSAVPNLGGLFSGGMPKLKATGLRSNIVEKEAAPQGSIPTPTSLPSSKRGPPPVPPPATQKPQAPMQSSPAAEASVPKGNFGKPMLAPKPPSSAPGISSQKPSPPPKKLNLVGGPSVSRAQSMRLPRSPPVLAPTAPSSLHQSQDCLNETPHIHQLQHHHHQNQHQQQYRPIINRALRPPIARPPSPPTTKTSPRESSHQNPVPTTTRAAPPPPSRLAVTAPSMPPPPPPPPNRSTSMHQRLAPPPPPIPPTRIASAAASTITRNGSTTMSYDLELRFADKFHSIMNFPNPAPFRGFPKVYNSKNAAKQQAPAPPLQSTSAPGTMLRLNASSGGKQWQHNAASSAC